MRCGHRAIIVCMAMLWLIGVALETDCFAQLNLMPSTGPQTAPAQNPAIPVGPIPAGPAPAGNAPANTSPAATPAERDRSVTLPPSLRRIPPTAPPTAGEKAGPGQATVGPTGSLPVSSPSPLPPTSTVPSTSPMPTNGPAFQNGSLGQGAPVRGPAPNRIDGTPSNPTGPQVRPAVRESDGRSTIKALMASRLQAVGPNERQDPGAPAPVETQDAAVAIQPPSGSDSNVPTPQVAQPPTTPQASKEVAPDANALSVETIAAQLKQIQTATDLDATVRQTLSTTYEAILAEAKKRTEEEKSLKEFAALFEAAPNATAEAKKRKESPSFKSTYAEGTLPLFRVESLQALQLETATLLQAATKGRADTETTIAARDARKKEMPRYMNEAKALIAKLSEELAAAAPETLDPRIRDANQLLTRAKIAAANTQLRRLELEQRTFDAEAELLPVRKELFAAEEKFYQLRLKEISEELGKRCENQIAMQRRMSEDLLAKTKPGLEADAQRIVKRTEDWLNLVKEHASLRMKIDEAKSEQKQWADRYKIMTDRLGRERTSENAVDRAMMVSRLKSLVGEMLRRQRNELPDIDELNRSLEDYQSKIESTQSIILSLDDWKAENAASTDPTQAPMNLESSLENYGSLTVTEQQQVLDATERRIVDEFRLDASNCSETLFNLALHNQQLIDQVRKYRDFIDEHILWIRSTDPFGKNDWNHLWRSIQELLDLKRWTAIPRLLLADIKEHVGGYGLAVSGLLLLMLYTKRMRKEMHDLGMLATKSTTTSFVPTSKAIFLCVLLSAPMTLIHLLLGWRLVHSSGSNGFIEAVGMGLLVGARYFFPLEMLRQIARSDGLAERHFQWPEHTTAVLRRHLRWFIDLAVPTVCLVGLIWNYSESRWENSLGRIAFSVLMILCSVVMLNVLHPRHGVFREYLERNAGGWIDRLSFLWYFGLSLAPIALSVMSLMGYHYTAIRLSMHLHTSCMTLIGILLVYCLICRWLLLRRRQLIVSQARQRLEEARRRDSDAPAIASAVAPVPLETEADLSSINTQTIRLVSSTLIFAAFAAIAFIWSSILPAVGVLDSISLWTVSGSTPDEKVPVTLANLLLAIPAAIMTVVAAKNLPGLLEIALLQHLPLENAVRYAITSISRYTILILGIAMTVNSLGVRWASVQWLVAALGVGLGFGLQEIFANFVSGLILLFEQPIRVGDVITVGDTTGTVSKIRMRATTVMNFDQQELVIPNKDLVTGRLLNWTLSDSTNRLIIEVGVAYGTDTDKACAILREICLNHPNVLKQPEPTAFFELFADSTLQLKARLFLASLDLRLPTRHELLTSIHDRFRRENIELAFPQRDIHIRTLPKDWNAGLGKTA
ncbi:MAG: mechanosensitive ion channel domain-containing protein [Pirellula sp.]